MPVVNNSNIEVCLTTNYNTTLYFYILAVTSVWCGVVHLEPFYSIASDYFVKNVKDLSHRHYISWVMERDPA